MLSFSDLPFLFSHTINFYLLIRQYLPTFAKAFAGQLDLLGSFCGSLFEKE
jgi:hypothetical protein